MTVSGVPHDHLCKQYRGVINCHPFCSRPQCSLTRCSIHLLSAGAHLHLKCIVLQVASVGCSETFFQPFNIPVQSLILLSVLPQCDLACQMNSNPTTWKAITEEEMTLMKKLINVCFALN